MTKNNLIENETVTEDIIFTQDGLNTDSIKGRLMTKEVKIQLVYKERTEAEIKEFEIPENRIGKQIRTISLNQYSGSAELIRDIKLSEMQIQKMNKIVELKRLESFTAEDEVEFGNFEENLATLEEYIFRVGYEILGKELTKELYEFYNKNLLTFATITISLFNDKLYPIIEKIIEDFTFLEKKELYQEQKRLSDMEKAYNEALDEFTPK